MEKTEITAAQVEAAARVIAHRMDFNENKWQNYADIARTALEAARSVADACTCGARLVPGDACVCHA